MISDFHVYIAVIFGLTTFLTLLLFNWEMRNSLEATTLKKSNTIIAVMIVWLIIQGTLAFNRIYSTNLKAFPPKLFILGILPGLLIIIFLFISAKGRNFIDSLPLKQVTYLNMVRIPVEIVLLLLYLNGAVPKLMTFEGGNVDILSGISALIVARYAFRGGVPNRPLLLIWNFVCLGLLVNIVSRALLSAPFPIQKMGFDQPDIGILYFPFIWLPTFVVPLVLFGHLVSIRQLLKAK